MIVLKKIDELKNLYFEDKIEVTIGNFDGVHLGHREFLFRIHQNCKQMNSKFVVITFVPHPVQVLKEQSGLLINTFRERRELLSSCGVDYLLEIDFTKDFSNLLPEDFLEKYIFSFSGIEQIYLGHDFVFGANKSGDYKLAKKICDQRGIGLVLQNEFRLENNSVSSSAVRNAIASGEIEKTNTFLGRPYFISGSVVKGQGRGKQLGFPTANMNYNKELLIPSCGVYVTRTSIQNVTYDSVTNVGRNPTFEMGKNINIETHLFNFDSDIYGENICVYFFKKIRDEKKFSSVHDLIAQIENDSSSAKIYLRP